MKRALLLVLLALGITTTMIAQSVIEADPARPLENGTVTITYRPALDDKDGNFNMKDVSEVWVYTGARGAAIAQDPSAPYYEKYGWNDLKNYPEMKLKNNGDGTHTLVIENIRAFYNVPDDKPVRELLFVFRNVDGTVQGSDRLLAVDLMATMLMRWSRNMPRPATDWPAIRDYVARMKALPSFRLLYEREGLTEWA